LAQKKGCTVEGKVRAALAEEETRLVAKGLRKITHVIVCRSHASL